MQVIVRVVVDGADHEVPSLRTPRSRPRSTVVPYAELPPAPVVRAVVEPQGPASVVELGHGAGDAGPLGPATSAATTAIPIPSPVAVDALGGREATGRWRRWRWRTRTVGALRRPRPVTARATSEDRDCDERSTTMPPTMITHLRQHSVALRTTATVTVAAMSVWILTTISTSLSSFTGSSSRTRRRLTAIARCAWIASATSVAVTEPNSLPPSPARAVISMRAPSSCGAWACADSRHPGFLGGAAAAHRLGLRDDPWWLSSGNPGGTRSPRDRKKRLPISLNLPRSLRAHHRVRPALCVPWIAPRLGS